MTDEIDLDRLGQAAAELGEVDAEAWIEKRRIVAGPTDAERRLVARASSALALAGLEQAGVLERNPTALSLPSMNRWQVGRLAAQGHALLWLLDQLSPTWASRPDRTFADIVKIEPPKRVAWFARELRRVGLHDLDELSPPDLMTGE